MSSPSSPSGRGGGEDTTVPLIFGAVLVAAFGPVVWAVVKRWAGPRWQASSSSAVQWAGRWWGANWWLVWFWVAAAVFLLGYRRWLRRRSGRRAVQQQALGAGLARVMGAGWDPARNLQVRRWRGVRPVVVQVGLVPALPAASREWRLEVATAARELLGRVEPMAWPDVAGGTVGRRRQPWATVRAVVPVPWWRRLAGHVRRRVFRRTADGSQVGPGPADAAVVEERLVGALAGLVPQPRPRVRGDRIVVGYGETTRDQSPAWRSRVVEQVSARFGVGYRARWDRQVRQFTLEPVPVLPHPLGWAEWTATLHRLDPGRWVAGYGTDENGAIVAWEPGDAEPHALISGDPGTGKTESMKALIDTLLLLGAMVAIIDPKQRDFAEYLGRPGIVCVATSVVDQVGALVDLEAEMMRRTAASALRRLERQYPDLEDGRYHSGRPAQAAIDEVPLIVVLDELTMHTNQVQEWWQRLTPPQRAEWGAEKSRSAPMLGIPSRIVALARAIKIHMLIGVQRPDASNFGGATTMRDNIKHMASMGRQSPIGSEMQWGDRRTGSEVETANAGEGVSNGLRIDTGGGGRLTRGLPGRFKAWYAADTAETEQFWAQVAAVAPDASLVELPHVSDAARDPAAAAAALRRQAYASAGLDPVGPGPDPAEADLTVDEPVPDEDAAAPALAEPADLPPASGPEGHTGPAGDRAGDGPSGRRPPPAGYTTGVPGPGPAAAVPGAGRDELLAQAAALVVGRDSGSAAMLQRELRVGYGRGRELMAQLEACGVVGPVRGRQARQVLATADELPGLLGTAGGRTAPIPATVAHAGGSPGELGVTDGDGRVWVPVAASCVGEGETVQFGDIASARVVEVPEVVVDEFDGAELVRLVLEVDGEEQTVDLTDDELVHVHRMAE